MQPKQELASRGTRAKPCRCEAVKPAETCTELAIFRRSIETAIRIDESHPQKATVAFSLGVPLAYLILGENR